MTFLTLKQRVLALLTISLFTLPVHASEVLRVGDQKQMLKAVLSESGALEGAPYAVEFFEFPAAAPLGEALNANAIDVGVIGDAPFVFAAAAKRGIKAVSATQTIGRHVNTILVPKNSPVTQVRDLKGKKLVTTRGSIGHYLALVALADAGLSAADVEFIFLLPGDARPLLDSGRVDAWAVWGPYVTIAVNHDQARILAVADDYFRSTGFLAATEKSAAQKTALLKDFNLRMEKANLWAKNNPEAYARVQSQITGLPYDIHLELEKNSSRLSVPLNKQVIGDLQNIADVYYKNKLLRSPLDVRDSFDERFIEDDGETTP